MAHVIFRADAGLTIGTGHVMRCLTLANALAQSGAVCTFLCRPHKGHLLDRIAAEGHKVIVLPALGDAPFMLPKDGPVHAGWLGVSWKQDAQDCLDALGETRSDWLVIDHYALDQDWERAMHSHYERLFVIDDLADRAHICDMLLDQNLGRKAEDYDGLVPEKCQRFIGPMHALLRPEFAANRAASLARRVGGKLKSVLITMGGIDAHNATGAVLQAMAEIDSTHDLQVKIVMGRAAPHLERVRALLPTLPFNAHLRVDVHNMAALMRDADLAIGAAGSTSWERCCLGLPCLMLSMADNQLEAARALDAEGIGIYLGDIRNLSWRAAFTGALAKCFFPSKLLGLSANAQKLCKGHGGDTLMSILIKE